MRWEKEPPVLGFSLRPYDSACLARSIYTGAILWFCEKQVSRVLGEAVCLTTSLQLCLLTCPPHISFLDPKIVQNQDWCC
jgi:hypothetical protein